MLSGSALTKEWLKDRLAIEEAVSKISRIFLSSDSVELEEVLSIIGKSSSVSRTCAICFNDNADEIREIHEWYKPAILIKHEKKDTDNHFYQWLFERLKRDNIIMIPVFDFSEKNGICVEPRHEPVAYNASSQPAMEK